MRLARKRLALKGDVQVLEMTTRWLLQTQLSGHASWGFYSYDPGLASLVGHPSNLDPGTCTGRFRSSSSFCLFASLDAVNFTCALRWWDLLLFFQKLLAFLLGAGEVSRGALRLLTARLLLTSMSPQPWASCFLAHHSIFLPNTLSGEGACERVQILLGPPATGVLHCHAGPHSAFSSLFRLLADLSFQVCVVPRSISLRWTGVCILLLPRGSCLPLQSGLLVVL